MKIAAWILTLMVLTVSAGFLVSEAGFTEGPEPFGLEMETNLPPDLIWLHDMDPGCAGENGTTCTSACSSHAAGYSNIQQVEGDPDPFTGNCTCNWKDKDGNYIGVTTLGCNRCDEQYGPCPTR